jgi:GT2 family glycosyltransferase
LTLTSIVKSIDDAEIIVVDNNSIDGAIEFCQSSFPEVIFIKNDENLGFAKANNLGVARASSDLILILNPDVVVSSSLFVTAFSELEKSSEMGAVCVQMIDGSGAFLPESKRGLPNIISSLYKITGIYKLFPKSKKLNQYYLSEVDRDSNEGIEVLSGACFFIRRSVYQEIGGFDERYFMYGEDIDLSLQLKNHGYSIQYIGSQKMIHFKGESSKKKNWRYHQVFFDAMYLFWKKNNHKHTLIKDLSIKVTVEALKIVSFAKEQLKLIAYPVVDFLFIYTVLFGFTKVWQTNIHGTSNYYPSFFLYGMMPLYVIFWIVGLWMAGTYSHTSSLYRNIKGVFTSSVVLLISYSLLPENYRYSRAIILAGIVSSIFIPILLRFIVEKNKGNRSFYSELSKWSFSIYPSAHLKDQIISCFHDFTNQKVHYVDYPSESKNTALIIDVESCQTDEIIKLVASNTSRKLYYIQSKNFIIDSSDKKKQGKVYGEGEGLEIYLRHNLISKRIFDILLSIIALFLAPYWIVNNKKTVVLALQVLTNKKTWIGTPRLSIGKSAAYVIDEWVEEPYNERFYLQNYTVWYDFDALWRQWF